MTIRTGNWLLAGVCLASLALLAATQAADDLQAHHEDLKNIETPSVTYRRSARVGRMLDLDKLAGEPSAVAPRANRRQSRTFADETSNEARQMEGDTKKRLAINGFIPIMSLESVKQHEGDATETEESPLDAGSTEKMRAHALQLLAAYGRKTSPGHASFAPAASEPPASVSDAAARAHRKLLPNLMSSTQTPLSSQSLLGGFSAPQVAKRLLPNFGNNNQQANSQNPAFKFQQTNEASVFNGDCVCVPFFQCLNGYLSESQLSKSQMQQLVNMAANQHYPQVPRSISLDRPQQQDNDWANAAAYSNQQQQQPQQQQQFVDDIYEQLKKNFEGQNLDANAQAALAEIAARNASLSDNAQQRSMLTQLAAQITKRQGTSFASATSMMARSCGIMRTCCKVPTHVLQSMQQQQQLQQLQQQQQQLQQQMQIQQQQQQQQPSRSGMQTLASMQQRPQNALGGGGSMQQFVSLPNMQQHQQQLASYQLLRPAATNPMLASNSAVHQTLVPPVMSQLTSGGGGGDYSHKSSAAMAATQALTGARPSGNFMQGRCGLRQSLGIGGRVQNAPAAATGENAAEFGEFPAHAAILKRISPGDNMFVCSAVLVSQQWLATAAHCVRKHQPGDLKVRLGEWDVSRDDEFYPFHEANVRELVVHPEFQSHSLVNDIALLRIDAPVDATHMPHIGAACLPMPDERPTLMGQRCWLAGWGKDAFGSAGSFQSQLRKVDLPLVGRHECEAALRANTPLGPNFRLHASAVCAGGEGGKDACEGDGGAGLYCTDPASGLTKVAGLVSWGVGCGQRGVPGVYTNLAHFYGWIERVVAAGGEDDVYPLANGLISERSNLSANNASAAAAAATADNAPTTTTVAPTSSSESALLSVADNDIEMRAASNATAAT